MTIKREAEHAEKEAFWKPHIDAWQSSQFNATDYCQQHNLNSSQFKYWQYQLAPHTKKRPQKKTPPPQFIECNTTPVTDRLPSSAGLEVKTTHGFSILIPERLPSQQLLELLSAVKQLAC